MQYENSLKFKNSELSSQWHPYYNGKLIPEDVTTGSNKKVWWQCIKGHEWQAIIERRNNGNGCPYCSGRLAIPGKTDLATVNPKLASELHPVKNGELKPTMVTANSGKKVWWQCIEGHEWQSIIENRNNGNGCPYCSGKLVILGKTDLTTVNPKLASEWHPVKNGELKSTMVTANSGKKVWWQCHEGHEWQAIVADRTRGNGCSLCSGKLAIPGKTDFATFNPKLASELHPVKNGELKPTANSGKKVWWQCIEGHEWQAIIGNRNNGNGCPYCSGKLAIPGKTDLATVNPKLANEWHPVENGELNPTMVTASSNKKVWWQCIEGHEWQATINNRNYGNGCPYCAGKLVIPGKTDFATVNPKLASEWHPTKNGNRNPTMVTVGSKKKVWWQCIEGHEWQARIENRNYGNGCPYCAGNLAIPDKTDLATLNSKLASEWHLVKNGELKPTMVTASSNKKVWWQCIEGHEWQATIENRNYGNGCPYCAGKLAIPGKTDLTTVNPKLASEWHLIKNGDLNPTLVTANSGKKVWWQCIEGHEWQARISDRNYGNGCPYCAGNLAIPGKTDLATVNPKLASEWYREKNGELKPTMVTASSGKKVWWQCAEGHEWHARIDSRNSGSGCPICINKKAPKKKSIS